MTDKELPRSVSLLEGVGCCEKAPTEVRPGLKVAKA